MSKKITILVLFLITFTGCVSKGIENRLDKLNTNLQNFDQKTGLLIKEIKNTKKSLDELNQNVKDLKPALKSTRNDIDSISSKIDKVKSYFNKFNWFKR